MWGNYSLDYTCSMARGRSGGLISMWDPSMFVKSNFWCDDNFNIVQGTWTHSNEVIFMINIYEPHDPTTKASLWNRILYFIQQHNGKFILCGDFNEVRLDSERYGSVFSRSEAQVFNSFIHAAGLVEIPMGGRQYTWMNKPGTKLSKLDCFLMTEDVLAANPDLKARVIDRLWSDHNPILLHIDKTDFGPIPFKLFRSWMQRPGFDVLIKDSCEEFNNLYHGSHSSLQKRLKHLKQCIKSWHKASNHNDSNCLHDIKAKLNEIDIKIDTSIATEEDRYTRLLLMQERDDHEMYSAMDMAQKARIRWDLEGDENTKFFHGILKMKRRSQMVQGILINGEWYTNPKQVKDAFFNFYKDKFQPQEPYFDATRNPGFTSLHPDVADHLHQIASGDEIKHAVWACGSDKAPGPDGFSFSFLKKYWEFFKDDVEKFVLDFMETDSLPIGTNSAFITLIPKVITPILITDYRPISLIGMQYKIISKLLANRLARVLDNIVSPVQSAFISGRQILDGPLMVSKIIDWYKKKNKKLMIFKVDFEKAFDSVNWSYLDYVLLHMGFANKWRSWIRSCLFSARTSIMVNGSPTLEFSPGRGLRQGDPLSPFLFILVMEGLNLAFQETTQMHLIKGVSLRHTDLNVSHFFFADDVVILTEWDSNDMENIIRTLNTFHRASGLKINIAKSNVFGIGVSEDNLQSMAHLTGCLAGTFPFSYLGLPIGKSMKYKDSWNLMVDKLKAKLSKWKANLLWSPYVDQIGFR
ncbi:putative RNA-directed DNA polymerase, eukaryota, reverse transcriptase zinc-binding domain protein [Tanacetum coccineum]